MSMKVVTFACGTPRHGLDLIEEQFTLTRAYKRTLVNLERARRWKHACNQRRHFPGLAALEQERADLVALNAALAARIKAIHAADRHRRGAKTEKAELAARKERLKAVHCEIVEAKAAGWKTPPELEALRLELSKAFAELPAGRRSKSVPDDVVAMQARYDQELASWEDTSPFHRAAREIEEWHRQAVKDARANSGVQWGAYLIAERSIPRTGPSPRFPSDDGGGLFAVQLIGGRSYQQLVDCGDRQLQIAVSRQTRVKRTKAVARIRVGSDGREPIWAVMPITIKRDIPPDAVVKWAYVVCRSVGFRRCWQLQLVVEDMPRSRPAPRSGIVGVDIGWRLVPGGLRVAFWRDDSDRCGTLILPDRLIDQWRHISRLQQAWDNNFDAMRDMAAVELADMYIPDRLREAVRNMRQWRSHARLASLYQLLCEDGVRLSATLNRQWPAWCDQDRLDASTIAHTHRRVVNRRVDIYRKWAAELAADHRTIVLEKAAWKELMRRPRADQPTPDGALREYQRLAAPYSLQACLSQAAEITEWVPAADTTRRCASCGEFTGHPDPAELIHECGSCGVRMDQDEIAAINLLMGGAVTQNAAAK